MLNYIFTSLEVNKKRGFTGLLCTTVILLCGESANAQNKLLPYDITLVSTEREVNFAFSAKRGIQDSDGTIYYVSGDRNFLEAYKDNRLLWRTDATAPCGELVGARTIRYIQSSPAVITLVVGKHSFIKISKLTGVAVYQGSD